MLPPLLAQQAQSSFQPLPHDEWVDPSVFEKVQASGSWQWLIYAAAAVLALGLLLWLLRGLVKRNSLVTLKPKRPWHEAVQQLRALQEQSQNLPPDHTAAQLSTTLRQYLADCYGVPAPSLTRQELFEKHTLPPAAQSVVRYAPLAQLWDELAYSPRPASSLEARELVSRALSLLEEERR
jgi:hypothetical protein